MTKNADIPRQILNLALPPAMWISSSLPEITGWGRTISEQSEANNTLLVPFGAAFAIWFPIFIGCITYGIIQALPKNRERNLFRDIGWWTAGSFALIALWGYMAAFPPPRISQWGTALVFIPAMLMICQAVIIATRRKAELSRLEGYVIWMPLSWLAGWCSLAVFLNWAQLGVHGPLGFGMSQTLVCLLTLAAALLWAVIMARRTLGSIAYLFPIIWGLGFLALARLTGELFSLPIAVAAIVGALVLMASAIIIQRQVSLVKI